MFQRVLMLQINGFILYINCVPEAFSKDLEHLLSMFQGKLLQKKKNIISNTYINSCISLLTCSLTIKFMLQPLLHCGSCSSTVASMFVCWPGHCCFLTEVDVSRCSHLEMEIIVKNGAGQLTSRLLLSFDIFKFTLN